MKKKHKILIVDDDRDNIDCLTRWFSGEEFEVLSAISGTEALKKTEEDHPDMILLDIMMPEMDGFEVAKKLKESKKHKGIPIVMLTAKHDTQSKVKGFKIGVDDVVFDTMPFQRPGQFRNTRRRLTRPDHRRMD